MILHDKSQPTNSGYDKEFDVQSFREKVVDLCHYAPPILLSIDMVFNKIKIPFR